MAVVAPDVPEEREYNDDGVDLTLIRWMLRMTPAERLRVLEGQIAFVERARRGRHPHEAFAPSPVLRAARGESHKEG